MSRQPARFSDQTLLLVSPPCRLRTALRVILHAIPPQLALSGLPSTMSGRGSARAVWEIERLWLQANGADSRGNYNRNVIIRPLNPLHTALAIICIPLLEKPTAALTPLRIHTAPR